MIGEADVCRETDFGNFAGLDSRLLVRDMGDEDTGAAWKRTVLGVAVDDEDEGRFESFSTLWEGR